MVPKTNKTLLWFTELNCQNVKHRWRKQQVSKRTSCYSLWNDPTVSFAAKINPNFSISILVILALKNQVCLQCSASKPLFAASCLLSIRRSLAVNKAAHLAAKHFKTRGFNDLPASGGGNQIFGRPELQTPSPALIFNGHWSDLNFFFYNQLCCYEVLQSVVFHQTHRQQLLLHIPCAKRLRHDPASVRLNFGWSLQREASQAAALRHPKTNDTEKLFLSFLHYFSLSFCLSFLHFIPPTPRTICH